MAQQRAVAELGREGIRCADVSVVMAHATTVVAGMLGIDVVTVLEPVPDSDDLRVIASNVEATDGRAIVRGGRSSSQAGLILRSGQTVVSEDVHADPRLRCAEDPWSRLTRVSSAASAVTTRTPA